MHEDLGTKGKLDVKLVRADGKEVSHPVLADIFDRLERGLDTAIKHAGEIFATRLHAHHMNAAGETIAHHDLGAGLVTTAGVNLLAADWTNTTATLKLENNHDSGTGTTTAAIGDTALQTPTGNARVTGTQSNPVSGEYQTVATLSYSSTLAITEWGLFSASSSGTMWDHKVFSAINVVSGDSIQFTYTVTCNAGG